MSTHKSLRRSKSNPRNRAQVEAIVHDELWTPESITIKAKKPEIARSSPLEVISEPSFERETIDVNHHTQSFSSTPRVHHSRDSNEFTFLDPKENSNVKGRSKLKRIIRPSSFRDFRLFLKSERQRSGTDSEPELLDRTSSCDTVLDIRGKKKREKLSSPGQSALRLLSPRKKAKERKTLSRMEPKEKMQGEIEMTKIRIQKQNQKTEDILGEEKNMTWNDLVLLHITLRMRIIELQGALAQQNS